MKSRQVWRGEDAEFVDEVSGRRVVRLTSYKGHSHLLYFTDEYWIDRDRFVFCSDRCGASNLYLYDLADRSVEQLTTFDGAHRPDGLYWRERNALCFWYGNGLWEMEIEEPAPRPVLELDPEWEHSGLHGAAPDGRYAYTAIRRAPPPGRSLRYNKAPAYLTAYGEKPQSRIVAIDVDAGTVEPIREEGAYIQHVNTSPTDSDLVTYCHEGPWAKVRQRIWGLRVSTGEAWPIRPQREDVAIGHEFFVRGGEWIGYHGRRLPGETLHTFGFVRPDNSEMIEHDFSYHCTHFTSYGLEYALGDGTPANVQPWFPSDQKPFLMLFKRSAEGYDGPRVLAFHRSTFNEQCNHPHAQFTPDGRRVLFTSDVGGYSNVYMVDVGDFYDLPTVADASVEWT